MGTVRPLVQFCNIHKSFGATRALRDVSFDVLPGSVHAIIGENGAGKSTLLNISSGVFPPDSGSIVLDGTEVHLGSPRRALGLGVAMIHQELAGLEHLSVAQNIMLGHEPRKLKSLLVDSAAMNNEARRHIERLHADIDVTGKLGELTVGKQQMVEIAKALSLNARLIIMDEPTSALSSKEIAQLFSVINTLRGQHITVIYISHRLEEIFEICDRVTVLRDGMHVGTQGIKQTSSSKLVEMMIGKEIDAVRRSDTVFAADAPPLLRTEGLSSTEKEDRASGGGGAPQFHDVSFGIRRGEVFGLFGLLGSGRTELAQALYGMEGGTRSGSVHLDGARVELRTIAHAQSLGIAYVPEDRKQQGIFPNQSIKRNTLAVAARRLARFLWLSRKQSNAAVTEYTASLDVRMESIHASVSKLSGGNQQKVILARWLAAKPKLLLLDEPTRGIDVQAKAHIYALIDRLAGAGMSILLISSELPEIFRVSDTIGVMRNGTLAIVAPRKELSADQVMGYATGEREADGA